MTITAGLSLAGGVYIPNMVVGALTGRMLGTLVQEWFPKIQAEPGVYAMIGAAGFVSGALRIPISAVTIMIELTGVTSYVMPLTLVCMTAKLLGSIQIHLSLSLPLTSSLVFLFASSRSRFTLSQLLGGVFTPSFYDQLIELKHLPYLQTRSRWLKKFSVVGEIMWPEVICLKPSERVLNIQKAIATHHSGFPIVDRHKRLLGNTQTFLPLLLSFLLSSLPFPSQLFLPSN
jgi:hypothetical protein